MGLDITAYSKLTLAPHAKLYSDGYPKEYDKFVRISDTTISFTEENWPGRTQPLTSGVYSFGASYDFKAGSYGGYSIWRDWLARIAGWGSARECWASTSPQKPFWELINFPDNEGVIGSIVAAKLAKDFADNEARVIASQSGLVEYLDKYRNWRKAFELASDNGAVYFH